MNAPVIVLNLGNGGSHDGLATQLQQLLANTAASAGVTAKPIGEVIEEFVDSKIRANFARCYTTGLRAYCNAFARQRETRPVHEFTTEDLQAWFDDRKEKPMTMQSNRHRLSGMFLFAIRKGYTRSNPVENVEKVRVPASTPQILKPRQAMRLVLWTLRNRPTMLAWLVLGLKAGTRPSECSTLPGEPMMTRVGWAEIDLEAGTVRIDASATKTRRRRVVYLTPDCVEWLKLAKEAGARLPLSLQTKRRYLRSARDAIRLDKWPADILRHTNASVLVATSESLDRTARNLGNSPGVLMRHYVGLMTKIEAARYSFAPRPRHWQLAKLIGESKRLGLNTR